MPQSLSVSIIICTCNRAMSLRRTLQALAKVRIPSNCSAELILVDNCSVDDTAIVAENAILKNIRIRYMYEEKKGLSNARNTGLNNAQGDIILFTDDDGLPMENWIEGMLTALVNKEYDAVTGHFTIPKSIRRPWLTAMHMWWLGSSVDAKPHNGVRELIGGNMGFWRFVLDRVPAFDPELGSGALGFSEDTLFGWQLAEAGFRIGYAHKAQVIHDLDPSRLERRHWIRVARERGRSEGYLCYHWEHRNIPFQRLSWARYLTKLWVRRSLQGPQSLDKEGCPLWEMSYVLQMEKNRQFCIESKRSRNYSRRGLAKCSVPM